MTNHTGFFPQDFEVAESGFQSLDSTLDSAIYDELESEFLLADHEDVFPTPLQTPHEGLIQRDTTPAVQLLNRVYFFPTDAFTFEHVLQFGLITSEETQQFTLWNAFISEGKNISSITSVAPEGTSLDVPALPIFFNGMQERTYNATVLEVGPANQDTDYFFTFGPSLFRLDILGQRLQELDAIFEPNWADPVKFSYELSTIIFRNQVFKEQRRPLHNQVLRTQDCSFLVDKEDFERAHNVLKRSHDKLFFAPIFNEILHPTNATLQGTTTLTFAENLSDYYNLRHFTTVLILKSITDPLLNEYITIDTLDLGSNEIDLDSPIVNSYVTRDSIIHPIFIATLEHFKPRYVTDKVASFPLTFRELRS